MQTLVGAQREAESSRLYFWEVPGRSVSIQLSRDVASALTAGGWRWFGLLRGRAEEAGGILLGEIERDGARTVLRIEESLEIPCEHLFGPSYSLSGDDKESLRKVLEHCRKDRRPIRPLGFYRTQTRRGFRLDPEDLLLFPEFFPGEHDVALLVKCRAIRRNRAAFFVAGESALEVRLGRAGRPTKAPQPPPKPRAPFWCSWWVQAPLLACLIAADGVLGFVFAGQMNRETPPPAAAQDPYALSLIVLEYGDNLHLTWDRNARPVTAGARARLFITDGGQDRSMDLTAAQLRNGSVIYRKVTDQVRFRLEVFMKERRSVSETWEGAVSAAEPPPPVEP